MSKFYNIHFVAAILFTLYLLRPCYADAPQESLISRQPDSIAFHNVPPDSAMHTPQQNSDSATRPIIKPQEDQDTSSHFWLHPYWGIGMGWGIGGFPLFSEWENGLPDSAADLLGENSQAPTLTIKEAATAYNVFWPIVLSYTPYTNETRSLTLESSMYFIFTGKSYIGTLTNEDDTTSGVSINWIQKCHEYFFTLGMSCRQTIPEEYFRVDGVNKTSMIMGLSFTPLIYVSETASFTSDSAADSTLAALKNHLYDKSFNGTGFSWKIGISTVKRLSSRTGLEIDLVYIGRWFGLFHDGSQRIKWRDINSNSPRGDKNLSFTSSSFEINLIFLSGKKDHSKK
jgi:hypothetical protein